MKPRAGGGVPGVLMVGNFLSAKRGTRFYCEDLADRLEKGGAAIVRTSTRPGRLARVSDMAATAWRERDRYAVATLDVYSGPSFRWAELIAALLRLMGKPVVATLHGGGLAEFARSHPARVRRFLVRAAAVVTPSRYLQETLSGLRPDIRYLPNAIDVAAYPFRHRSRLKPILCWLRAFDATYDPGMAVEALRRVRESGEEATLSMVGRTLDPEVLAGVQRAVAEHGLGPAVTIPGPVPKSQVAATLGRHDIFLNTTRYESFGVAVLEAAASGLPVVTTRVGEIPYLWKHDVDALLVEPGDAEAMAQGVLRLLREPELAARLSGAARARAEEFGWEAVLPKWVELFQRLPVAG